MAKRGVRRRVWVLDAEKKSGSHGTVWVPWDFCRAGNPRSGVAVARARPKGGMADRRFMIQDRVAADRPVAPEPALAAGN